MVPPLAMALSIAASSRGVWEMSVPKLVIIRFVVNRRHAFSQAGGRQRQRLRGRLEPAEFGRPHEGRRTRHPVARTAGFPRFPAFPDTITPCSRLVDDRTDDRAFGADDVAPLRPKFRKLRFRSEEHTSELQSRQYLVWRLLLEKKVICERRSAPTASSVDRRKQTHTSK